MKHIQNQVQKDVKRIMSEQLYVPSASSGRQVITKSDCCFTKPSFIASASVFGPKVMLSNCSTAKQSINSVLQLYLSYFLFNFE